MFSYTAIISLLCGFLFSNYLIFVQSESSKSTLIFIDKSQSADFNKSEVTILQISASLDTLLKTRYAQNKDKLYLYYIHANTAGAAKIKEFIYPANQCNDQPSKIKKVQCEKVFINKINMEKRNIRDDIIKLLYQTNPTKTGNYTNIHAILEVASRNFTNPWQSREIYVFSDMIHTCQKYNLSNFTSRKVDAEALGRKHAEEVRKELEITDTNLTNTRVIVITPDDPINPTKNKQALRYYWNAFFKQYNMKLIMD